MIAGIGTDIVMIERFKRLVERHGHGVAEKILGPRERLEYVSIQDKSRFLAKRFAAKEALAKALGTGLRPPVSLAGIEVTHDALGKPQLQFSSDLAAWILQKDYSVHLSISDEKNYAVAVVILEVI